VPARLLAALQSPPRRSPLAAAAAALAVAVLAGLAGWSVGRTVEEPAVTSAAFAEDVFEATLGDPLGDGFLQRATLTGQGLPVEALRTALPDLSEIGFRLVGSDVAADEDGPTVRGTYAAEGDDRVGVFLRWEQPADGETVVVEQRGDLSLAHWHERGLSVAVISELSPDETTALADAIHGHLRRSPLPAPAPATPDGPQGTEVIADAVLAPVAGTPTVEANPGPP
jgi:anti-sigma factor RsiW